MRSAQLPTFYTTNTTHLYTKSTKVIKKQLSIGYPLNMTKISYKKVTAFCKPKVMRSITFNYTNEIPIRPFRVNLRYTTVKMEIPEALQPYHPKLRAKLLYKYLQRRVRIHLLLHLFKMNPEIATEERKEQLYKLARKL